VAENEHGATTSVSKYTQSVVSIVRSYVIKPAVTNYQSSTLVTTVGHPQETQQIVVYKQENISDGYILALVFILALLLLFCGILFVIAIPMCAKATSLCQTQCPGLWFPLLFVLYLTSLVLVVNVCKEKETKTFGFVSYQLQLQQLSTIILYRFAMHFSHL